MGSRHQARSKRLKSELARRQKNRLRSPDGWQPPPAPEAAWLNIAPVAAAGESVQDRAVFDADACGQLPPDIAAEAVLVRESLDLVAEGRSLAALDRLASVGRKSPYADWRLFLRGLVPFQQGNHAAARDAWNRLEPGRRPARIAAALSRAWEGVAAAATGDRKAAAPKPSPSSVDAAAVALMRRDSLWTAAREIASIRHRDEEQTMSASQAALAIRLEKQYRLIDPDFVREFSAACRLLAIGQADTEPLLVLCRGTAGAPDDPRSNRLRLIHNLLYDGDADELRQIAREYVDRDLPGLTHLPAPLRAALASETLLRTADGLLDQSSCGGFGGLTPHDERVCERLLREAIERYPGNRQAHESLIEMLENRAEDETDRDARRAIVNAKLALVELFPDRHEEARDLIDGFVARGEFQKAEPLVRQLADQRCGDAVARATPWRFELLRASWLAATGGPPPQVREAVEAAIAAWPAWMSRQWIPFLEAAMLLREGNETGFESAAAAARENLLHDLHADAMLHEALLRLHCPEPRIEPVRSRLCRAAVDVAVDSPIAPLAAVACFCMDNERSGLPVAGADHPARAIGRALSWRLGQEGTWRLGMFAGNASGPPVEDPAFWGAFRWLAAHDFFGAFPAQRVPRGIAGLADTHPQAAAELLSWLSRAAPDALTTRKSQKRLKMVEQAADADADPGVRRRLEAIVATVRETIAAFAEQNRPKGRGRPIDVMGFGADAFEPTPDMPPLIRLILERGGPAAVAEALGLLTAPRTKKNAERIVKFAVSLGISQAEFMEAISMQPPETDPFTDHHPR